MAISMKLLKIILLVLSSTVSIIDALQSAHHQQPQQQQPIQLDPQCLNCICHASSDCQTNLKCHNAGPEQYYCGPYQISWAYWADGGKPGNTGQSDDFEKCLVDKSCAEIAIHGYMNRYGHDCNGDGRVDCLDFAAIHKAGPSVSGCKQNWLLESKYWSKFLQCYNGQSSSNSSSLPSSENFFQPQPINHPPSNSFQAPPNNQQSSYQQPNNHRQPINSFQPNPNFKPSNNLQQPSTNHQPRNSFNNQPNNHQPSNSFEPNNNPQEPPSHQPDFQSVPNNRPQNSYNDPKPNSPNYNQPEDFQPGLTDHQPTNENASTNHHSPNLNRQPTNSYQPSDNRAPASNSHHPENFQPGSDNQPPNSYEHTENNNRRPANNHNQPEDFHSSPNHGPQNNNRRPTNNQPDFSPSPNRGPQNTYEPNQNNNRRPANNHNQPEDFHSSPNHGSHNSYEPSHNNNNRRPINNNQPEDFNSSSDRDPLNSYEPNRNNNRRPANNHNQPEDFHSSSNHGPQNNNRRPTNNQPDFSPNRGAQNSYEPNQNNNNRRPINNNHDQPEDFYPSPNRGPQNSYEPNQNNNNRKPPNNEPIDFPNTSNNPLNSNKPLRKNNVPVNLYEPNHDIPHSSNRGNNQSSNPYEDNSNNVQPSNSFEPNNETNSNKPNQPSINSENTPANNESPNSFDHSPNDYHQPNNQPIHNDSRPSNSLNDIFEGSPNSYDDSITHRQDSPNNHHPENFLHDTTTNQPPQESSTIDNIASTSTIIEVPRIPRTTLTIPRLPRIQIPPVTARASASVPGASASASASAGFDSSGIPVTFASTSTNDDTFDLAEFTRSFPNPLNTNFHSIIANTLNKPLNFRQPLGFNRNGFSLNNNNRFNNRPLPAPLPPPSAPRLRSDSVPLPPQPSSPTPLPAVPFQPSFTVSEHNNSDRPSPVPTSEIEHENIEEAITKSCFNCLCQASTKCELNKGCDGAYCGPYLLSWGYWADGGQPGNDYVICTKQKYCSERAIEGYMEKWKRDCNGDGIIDCTDYAMIHKLGPHGCARIQALQGTDYWNQFTQCHEKSNKPARSPVVFDLPPRSTDPSTNELPSSAPLRSIRPNLIENSIVLKPGNRIRINNRGEILNNQPNSLREIPKPIRPTEPPRTRIDLSYFNQSRPIIIRIKPPIANSNNNSPQTPPIPNRLVPTPPSPPLPGPLRPSLRPTPVQPSPPVRNEVIELKPLTDNNNENYFTEPRPSENENKPSNVFEIPRRSSNDEEPRPNPPLVPSPRRNNNTTSSTNELIGQECMECICYASSKCSNSIGCRSELGGKHVCGPYQINWEYWAEAGKPGSRGDLSGLENFQMCANNRECADQTVRDYITRWRKDCNEDGVIDCNDYAALHVAGPNQCDASWYAESKYYSDFRECYDF